MRFDVALERLQPAARPAASATLRHRGSHPAPRARCRRPCRARLAGPVREAAALVLALPGRRRRGAHRAHGAARRTTTSTPGRWRCRAASGSRATSSRAGPRCARPAEEVGLDVIAADVTVLGTLDTVDVRVVGLPHGARRRRRDARAAVRGRRPRGGGAAAACPSATSCPTPRSRSSRRSATAGVCATVPSRSQGYRVWGATGRVLAQLGAVLASP